MFFNVCRYVLFLCLLGGINAIGTPLSVANAAETVSVGGVGSLLGTMKALGRAFEQRNPDVQVKVLPSLGTSGGLRALEDAAIDIALVGRPLTSSEESNGFVVKGVAKTPIVFVTSPENTVSDIALSQVLQIFTGEMQTWPDGQRIRLVLRPAGDSDTILLKQLYPSLEDALDIALKRKGLLFTLTDQENADALQHLPGGFGFTTLAQMISEKRPIKVLALDGKVPSLKSLANESYPFCKEMFIAYRQERLTVATKNFIDFVASDPGRQILAENGSLPMGSGTQ